MTRTPTPSSIDPAEIAKFQAMARDWWDPTGKFKPLHKFNPVRLAYLRDTIASEFGRDSRDARPLTGLRVLDIDALRTLVWAPSAELLSKH